MLIIEKGTLLEKVVGRTGNVRKRKGDGKIKMQKNII